MSITWISLAASGCFMLLRDTKTEQRITLQQPAAYNNLLNCLHTFHYLAATSNQQQTYQR
jgi:hypothetical protein